VQRLPPVESHRGERGGNHHRVPEEEWSGRKILSCEEKGKSGVHVTETEILLIFLQKVEGKRLLFGVRREDLSYVSRMGWGGGQVRGVYTVRPPPEKRNEYKFLSCRRGHFTCVEQGACRFPSGRGTRVKVTGQNASFEGGSAKREKSRRRTRR